MELFGATTITRKIILEGGLVVIVDGLSGDGAVGGGSGAAVGANDAPLTVFKPNHYEYDHTGYTDFASLSECSACKYQDCKAKHDVVINAINALTTSVKELTSKRGLIPSKRILFPSSPLEIRAKWRRRVIFKALSSIQKSEIATPLSVCCTDQRTMYKGEQHKLKKVNICLPTDKTNRHISVSTDDTSAKNYQTDIYICCNCCLTCCIRCVICCNICPSISANQTGVHTVLICTNR
jgi:hypothetical protein